MDWTGLGLDRYKAPGGSAASWETAGKKARDEVDACLVGTFGQLDYCMAGLLAIGLSETPF